MSAFIKMRTAFRPRNRPIATSAPIGRPMTQANTVAVRLTCRDRKTISSRSGSPENTNATASPRASPILCKISPNTACIPIQQNVCRLSNEDQGHEATRLMRNKRPTLWARKQRTEPNVIFIRLFAAKLPKRRIRVYETPSRHPASEQGQLRSKLCVEQIARCDPLHSSILQTALPKAPFILPLAMMTC